ncbi:hypothetical protein [Nocardioides lijunqiniae]|uniref:hypothetical protein n=1 Tax=Nocardioides lijunqiniae TaxID=2760832 RepID=UPI00187880E5|nr:hypothetical protein [Nocardioides lijunqiniae]
MAKRDVDKKVKSALDALLAEKETAVRTLAEVLDKIETEDQEIAERVAARNALLEEAETAHAAAKAAGWKPRELADAGLGVPKSINAGLPAVAPSRGSGSTGPSARVDVSFPPHGEDSGGASGVA